MDGRLRQRVRGECRPLHGNWRFMEEAHVQQYYDDFDDISGTRGISTSRKCTEKFNLSASSGR